MMALGEPWNTSSGDTKSPSYFSIALFVFAMLLLLSICSFLMIVRNPIRSAQCPGHWK